VHSSRRARLVSAWLAGIGLLAAAAAQANTVYWTDGGGQVHQYQSVNGSFTWDEAYTAANAAGGYLATITSADERAAVSPGLVLLSHSWIGGYQTNGSGSVTAGWNWVTGETWSYTNWAVGEPNDGDGTENNAENHLVLPTGSSFWNDYPSTSPRGYVLETIVPEPATSALFAVGLAGLAGIRRRRRAG
jgi:hypothetical protein